LVGHSLHLDGCIVMVDRAKALVNITRLPYWFLDELKELGIETIHCWPSEGHAVNSLALRPGRILISDSCPRTVERLNEAGVETVVLDYSEVRKNGGGIHCSTLPLVRERA
jgi:N-dimethylarginine dimethylaminohydrolase